MSDELRARLEDGAELLEATRLRLRALAPALEGWRWKHRLRALSDVARQVARSEPKSRATLGRAQRRAESEAWPAGATRELVEETAALQTRLDAALKTLGYQTLRDALGAVVGVPRAVPLPERDAAAAEVLDPDDEPVLTLTTFADALEALFGRPLVRGARLPFTLDEFDAALARWPEGVRALDEGWARVTRVDTTGGVERALRRRAKQAPGRRGAPGPRALTRAAFWLDKAEATLAQLVEERVAPVQPLASERVALTRWLLLRERDGAARLEGEAPRAVLVMLAHEVFGGFDGRARLDGGLAQVRRWASLADALEGDEDWRRLRDGLRQLRVTPAPVLPPLYRVGTPARSPPRAPARLADFFADGAAK